MCRPNMDLAGQRYTYCIKILNPVFSETEKVKTWTSKAKLSAIQTVGLLLLFVE